MMWKKMLLVGTAMMVGSCVFPRFVGTPEEEIKRKGGKIEIFSEGAVGISLTGPRVGDADMSKVAALCGNHSESRTIQRLDISGSKVTDEGLNSLSGLTSLKLLDLRRSNVTEAGASAFKKRVPACETITK